MVPWTLHRTLALRSSPGQPDAGASFGSLLCRLRALAEARGEGRASWNPTFTHLLDGRLELFEKSECTQDRAVPAGLGGGTMPAQTWGWRLCQ